MCIRDSDCSNHTLAAIDPCPSGASSSTLLVDTEFTSLKEHTRFSCIRTIPNKYQRSGFAAANAWDAWKQARGMRFEDRQQKMLYVGRKLSGQRLNLMNETNWYTKGMPLQQWLATPDHMEMNEAIKYRYQIDIGGSSGTTWDALMWKLSLIHI